MSLNGSDSLHNSFDAPSNPKPLPGPLGPIKVSQLMLPSVWVRLGHIEQRGWS